VNPCLMQLISPLDDHSILPSLRQIVDTHHHGPIKAQITRAFFVGYCHRGDIDAFATFEGQYPPRPRIGFVVARHESGGFASIQGQTSQVTLKLLWFISAINSYEPRLQI
jgi:hypothetical protein